MPYEVFWFEARLEFGLLVNLAVLIPRVWADHCRAEPLQIPRAHSKRVSVLPDLTIFCVTIPHVHPTAFHHPAALVLTSRNTATILAANSSGVALVFTPASNAVIPQASVRRRCDAALDRLISQRDSQCVCLAQQILHHSPSKKISQHSVRERAMSLAVPGIHASPLPFRVLKFWRETLGLWREHREGEASAR